ncbi:MAG: hypothetical protein AB7D28_03895 [Candidatus Berkiella sp.]
MDNTETIRDVLLKISPAKRLKFLRQKIAKKNQSAFCLDGIIRSGTLKSIETEKLKISPKIAERLVHKFKLEGIICESDLFLKDKASCQIIFDHSQQNIISNTPSCLEEIRKKLTTLTPIDIDKDLCPSIIPNGATALAKELTPEDLLSLSNTLCVVHGTKVFISFLSYENEKIISTMDGKIDYFSPNIFSLCGVYAIELLFYNKSKE